jgi:hypothetical protein
MDLYRDAEKRMKRKWPRTIQYQSRDKYRPNIYQASAPTARSCTDSDPRDELLRPLRCQ